MNDKILELAKKLKELADRGIDGEKANARILLNRLLKKHHLTLEDLESNIVTIHYFTIPKNQMSLFEQIVYTVLDRPPVIYIDKRKKTRFFLECTDIQFIEINAMLDFYWKDYSLNLELFFSAYIHKNHLFPPSSKKLTMDDIDDEEFEKIKVINQMTLGIKKQNFRKQLND